MHRSWLPCQAVNFSPDLTDNNEAAQLLDGHPTRAYVVWHVPFEDNLFRLSYVAEEGPFTAPIRVVRCVWAGGWTVQRWL